MTLLVTGATGNIGRRVVDRLLAAGATEVRALTVDPARGAAGRRGGRGRVPAEAGDPAGDPGGRRAHVPRARAGDGRRGAGPGARRGRAPRRALADDAHLGRALSLTGPEVLTRVQLVEQLAAALRREVRFVEASRDEAVAAPADAMGEDAGWYVDAVLADLAAYPASTTATIRQVTGRDATPFARWAADNAARFAC